MRAKKIRIIASSKWFSVDHTINQGGCVPYLKNLRKNFVYMVNRFGGGDFKKDKMVVEIIKL